MSLIKKMINNRKIVYLNSPKFLLNLKNDEKNRKINTKISHKNIEDLTKCLNCISQDPSMSNINRQLLNEQADHFESLNFYCGDRCFAENVLYIECVTKLLAFYVSNPKRCKIDNLRGLTVQWLEFFEQYLILMTEYYCLNKYGVEAKWEDDGSFYIGNGVDKNNIIELIFEIIGKINDFVVEIDDLNNDLDNVLELIKDFSVSNIVSNLIFDDKARKHNYTVTEIDNIKK